jgi:GT2 family glycosyltransferase/2-polyprenyl-3-methyl-5-hydroxy-6-metoxy-1,4-benzoquinol methylase
VPRYDLVVNLDDPNQSLTQMVLLAGEGRRVLEIGPATGYVTAALTGRGCRVTAVEIDAQAAALAAPHCERMIVGSIDSAEVREQLRDESFDVIVAGDVLEHLADPAETLRWLRGLLTPGGSVVASIPNVAHGSVRLALLVGRFRYTERGLLDSTHVHFFTDSTVHELFAAAGFIVQDERRITVDPFGSEIELDERDFPDDLVRALRADPNAMTYQYVVRALPSPAPPAVPGDDDAMTRWSRSFREDVNHVRDVAAAATALAEHRGRILDSILPPVDVVCVTFNSERFVGGFLDSIRGLAYPFDRLRVLIVDNGSADKTLTIARQHPIVSEIRTEVLALKRNAGFGGGVNHAIERGRAPFVLVINPDTVLDPAMLGLLAARMLREPDVGIAEALQSPREHPKVYDPVSGDTPWSSGGGALLRRAALEETGGFDATFFLYVEDVDLSWRMWRKGWRCVLVRDARYEHFTEDLDPSRDRTPQLYFGVRNGFFMRWIWGSPLDVARYARHIWNVIKIEPDPERRATLKHAAVAHAKYVPHLLARRIRAVRRPRQARFYGDDYAEHRW